MQDRRAVLKRIGVGIAAVSAGSGVAAGRGRSGNAGRRTGASAEDGIVATADELGFSTLLTAVENADPVVAETLTNDDQYTVFAPTNEAFTDFFETVEMETGLTASDLLEDPNGLLTDTLLFHVTEGRRYSESVVNAPEIETLLGESFSVDGTRLDDRANIITADVEAQNGVIHAIDAVLTPSAVDDLL
ncbi:MAG: putative surface protein with fasciclin (FAS1) repeats [Natronomonas sp.]|jgi:uncharacterized surface protein with fasciclin (FAS1) repeats